MERTEIHSQKVVGENRETFTKGRCTEQRDTHKKSTERIEMNSQKVDAENTDKLTKRRCRE
jgi:hypothetical protein